MNPKTIPPAGTYEARSRGCKCRKGSPHDEKRRVGGRAEIERLRRWEAVK